MGRSRLRLVHTLLALIIGGTLFDIVTGREHWPFSPYPMYAPILRSPSLRVLRLFGVTRQGTELPLCAFEYIQPFNQARLTAVLGRLSRHPGNERALREACRDCLRRYEAGRRAGRHRGPPLRAIRMYRLHWELKPGTPPTEGADRRELLVEIQQPRMVRPADDRDG